MRKAVPAVSVDVGLAEEIPRHDILPVQSLLRLGEEADSPVGEPPESPSFLFVRVRVHTWISIVAATTAHYFTIRE